MKDDGLENAVRRALAADARALRARADLGRRSRRRSSPSATARRSSSASATASSSSPPTSPPSSATRATSSSSATRRWPSSRATGVDVHGLLRAARSSKATQRVLWDPIMAEKAGYKHFMLKEIFEQPTAARETILGRVSQDTGKVFLEEMQIADAELRGGRAGHDPRVRHLVARGAGRQVPDRAAGAAAGRGRLRLGVPLPRPDRRRRTRWPSSSRSRARPPTRWRRCARPSARAAPQHRHLQRRRQHGDARDRRHDLHARRARRSAWRRPRRSRRSSSRCTCWRCGSAQVRGALSPEASQAARRRAAAAAAAARADAEGRAARSRRSPRASTTATDFLYLGRGINYPIALEGALKLKEISYIHAEGYPAGEMKHGPIALIDEQHAGRGARAARPRVREDDRQHAGSQGARRLGHRAHDATATTRWRRCSIRARDVVLELPPAPALLTPIVMVLPLQLLAYHIAVRRGCDVDQPRNLAKSVTVE